MSFLCKGCYISCSTWNMALVGTTIRAQYTGNDFFYRYCFSLEKIRLINHHLSCSLKGSYAGAVLGIPLSGILTEYLNWQVAFYFYGLIFLFCRSSKIKIRFFCQRNHRYNLVDLLVVFFL